MLDIQLWLQYWYHQAGKDHVRGPCLRTPPGGAFPYIVAASLAFARQHIAAILTQISSAALCSAQYLLIRPLLRSTMKPLHPQQTYPHLLPMYYTPYLLFAWVW